MSLIFIDGFDHYGGVAGNMTDGAYAEVSSGNSLVTSIKRTGNYSLRITSTQNQYARRVLGGIKSTVITGFAIYFDSLPTTNDDFTVITYRDASNAILLRVYVQSTGIIKVEHGDSGASISTIIPVVTAETWQYMELKSNADISNGSFELRINGVTVLSGASINTGDEYSQISLGGHNSGNTATSYIDDWYVFDADGALNNDFIGDVRVRTSYPDSDQATQEWSVVGAASGYDAINDINPDDDSSYIEASPSVPVTSEFGIEDLPSGIGAIFGVQSYVRQMKTDAGDANTQVSMISNGSVSDGSERPITTQYTYWTDVFETDPDTGSLWTPASLDAATLRIRRTV